CARLVVLIRDGDDW
nr:immunoglobulin heavy chain junction region [Macaca mulatta]